MAYFKINRSRGRAEFFLENLGDGLVLEILAIHGEKFLMSSPARARVDRGYNVGFRVVVAAPLSTLLLSELMNGNSSGVPKRSPDLLE